MRYREKCLQEKGEKCSECGATEEIEVHHVDGNRWNNSLENLIPLCRDCHMAVHTRDGRLAHLSEQINKRDPRGVTEEHIGEQMGGETADAAEEEQEKIPKELLPGDFPYEE